MQIACLIGRQQRQVHLHKRLGTALTTHPGVSPRRIQPNLRRTGQDHPIHILLIRNSQPTRHRRRTLETSSWRIERFILVAEHRDSPITPSNRQHRRVDTQRLHRIPQPLHQMAATLAQQRRGPAHRVRPLRHLPHPGYQLMGCQQPNIAQPRNRGVQLSQRCQQESGRRMMVGLTQRNSRQTLHLGNIQIMANHRLVTRRPTQRDQPTIRSRIGSNQQHRARPAGPPLRPRPPHHRSVRPPSRLHQHHFKPIRHILGKQPRRPQRFGKPLRCRPPNRITLNQKLIRQSSHTADRPPTRR